MISESNFVLGIKQKSLASKENSHVHITVRSHTCLSAGFRLHSILQPPWLTAVSKSSNQASRDLTYQIYANPSFACWNQNHRHAPWPLSIQTQEAGLRWNCHAPLCAETSSKKFPRATSDSWLSDRLLGTRATMTASSSTDLQNPRFWHPFDLTRTSLVSSFSSC